MTRRRTAQNVVTEVGYSGPVSDPLLDPTQAVRYREITRLRAPEPFDIMFLFELIGTLERGIAERDRQNYERGRVDERLYWRARQKLAGKQFSEPLKLAPLSPLIFLRSRSRGWEVTAPVSWVVTGLITGVLLVGMIIAFVP